MKHFPTKASGPIPGDPYGRTYAELDHWYKQQGTSLYRQCVVYVTASRKKRLLKLARAGEKRPSSRSTDAVEKSLAKAFSQYTLKGGPYYDPLFEALIRQHRPDWFCRSDEIKRENAREGTTRTRLIDRAKMGLKRPTQSAKNADERKLSYALSRHTNKGSTAYDPVFDVTIRDLQPGWFVWTRNSANGKKTKLLRLARSGEKRPSARDKNPTKRRLAYALSTYINQGSHAYDPIFNKQIRQLRPDWFVNTAATKKAKLRRLARSGAKRPPVLVDGAYNSLGDALLRYTCVHHRCYNAEFDRKIRKLRPDWFPPDLAKKKMLLLARGRAEKARPSCKAVNINERTLGNALSRFTRRASPNYDPDFNQKIREVAPAWFVNTSDWTRSSPATKKAELLKLARTESSRPIRRSSTLSDVLSHYTSKTSSTYDVKFDTKIRKLRPDWFVRADKIKAARKVTRKQRSHQPAQ